MTFLPRLLATLASALSCGAMAMAEEAAPPLLPDFPPDAEICFGRVYGEDHLAKHQKQKVTEIYLYRSLTGDTEDETLPQSKAELAAENIEWERTTRAEGVIFDGSLPGRSTLDLLVKLKDRPEMFLQQVECRKNTGEGFTCGVDCDGGGFSAARDGSAIVIRQDANSGGLRVQAGCTSGDESAPEVRIDPDDDALAFRLDPMPMNACHSARDASRPDWAKTGGPPLRVRLAEKEGLCFVSPPGAARSGDKRLERLALKTLEKAATIDDDNRPMLKVELNVALKGGKKVTRTLDCTGENFAFECSSENEGFRLTRNGARGVTLRETYYEGGSIARLLELGDEAKVSPIALDAAKCD